MVKKKSVRKGKNVEKTKRKSSTNDRYGQYLKYVLISMGALILILVAAYFIIQSGKQFEFLGLQWDKQMFGEIKLYHAQIGIVKDGSAYVSDIFLRNDPRSLDIPNETIKFKRNIVYFSINNSVGDNCKEGTSAFTDLGKFFATLGIEAKLALSNESEAQKLNMPYVTCDNTLNSSVFMFQGGEKTRVRSYGDCHIVEVANCELTKAAETIMVGSIYRE